MELNQSNTSHFSIPEKGAGDYLEISLLSILVLIGVPLNLVSIWNTNKTRKAMPSNFSKQHELHYSCFLLMKLNMSVANLFMLLGYCTPFVIWMMTYRWLWGDCMCRLYKFMTVFAFHASSHMVEAMALERVQAIFYPATAISSWWVHRHRLLIIAWVSAALLSTPCLIIFNTYKLNDEFTQCTTIWNSRRFDQAKTLEGRNLTIWAYTTEETLLTAIHLCTNFWLPMTIITIAYACLYARAKSVQRMSKSRQNNRLEIETSGVMNAEKHFIVEAQGHRDNQSSYASSKRIPQPRLRMTSHRLFNATLLVVLAFILCWSPYFCVATMDMFNINLPWQITKIVKPLVVSESAFNIFLYRIPNLKPKTLGSGVRSSCIPRSNSFLMPQYELSCKNERRSTSLLEEADRKIQTTKTFCTLVE